MSGGEGPAGFWVADAIRCVRGQLANIATFPQSTSVFTRDEIAGDRSYFGRVPAHVRLAPVRASGQNAPIRVALADDHAAMRRNVRLLVEAEGGVEVIAEAVDLPAVARHVHGQMPNVVILDLQLPNGSSIGLIRQLREQAPLEGSVGTACDAA